MALAPHALSPLQQLLDFDAGHLWHPYTSMQDPASVRLVRSAFGVRLSLADGRQVIDAMSSWWCAIHGYRHPVLDNAVREQVASMSHVMYGGLTHEPAIRLGQRLVEISPAGLEHVFFADSGSVSVEVALKMAQQYQRGAGHPERTRFLSLYGGYHGDTLGAMSVCDPVGGMHSMFAGTLPEQVFADRPPAGFDSEIAEWAERTSTLIAKHSDELAAVIVEPVLQGAGGMHIYNPFCLRVLRELCDRHGLLLIFDEIATGFGRTGTLFAAEFAAVSPDLMCVGKAMTGGYLTMAAVLATSAVAHGISASESGVLMHGPTYMANPLAAAVASASIDLLLDSHWQQNVLRIERRLRQGLAPAHDLPGVVDVRALGAVGVIQLDSAVDVDQVSGTALEYGVWVRPFRDLVYTMPPYISTDEDIDTICAALCKAVAAT